MFIKKLRLSFAVVKAKDKITGQSGLPLPDSDVCLQAIGRNGPNELSVGVMVSEVVKMYLAVLPAVVLQSVTAEPSNSGVFFLN